MRKAWLVKVTMTSALSMAVVMTGVAAKPISTSLTLNLVSQQSPYATSTIGGPGTNYLNAEVEPWVDVNPTNVSNFVGAWQQDRWNNGGAHGLVAGYSFDGGATWNETPLPFTSSAPGGLNYERASDPWVSFGPDGTLYTISISFNQSNNDNCVATATSTDGGKSWQNLHTLIQDTGTYQYFNDKESVTADPIHAGTAYAVWDRLVSPSSSPYADAHATAFTGPTMFSKTTDGGRTWTTPQVIVNTPQNSQTIGNQIVVDPHTGTLYDFYDLIQTTTSNSKIQHGNNVAFSKSTDGGTSWTNPQVIAPINDANVIDPNTSSQIRTGDIIPEPTIDSSSGKLYVVWQDGRFSNGDHADIAISSSADGGSTWSQITQVNPESGRAAFNPQVRVNSDGKVGVTYYDLRNLTTQTTTLPTDYWFTTSTDGMTFGNEVHLAGSFDLLTAPNAEGNFVGDYEGLVTVGTEFYPFFVQTNSGNTVNPTDVFFTKVTP